MTRTADAIRTCLESLGAVAVEVDDQSARHAGHAGAAGGGGHYHLRIVAPCFQGLSRLGRHRLVYDALGPLMKQEIHALSITAHTPEETRKLKDSIIP